MADEHPTAVPTPAPRRPRNGKPRQRSLVTKLSEVQASIDGIEKTAIAEMGSFSFAYIEEHQVLDAVRGELAKRHVMIIPEIIDLSKVGQDTILKMRFTMMDGDSDERIISEWGAHAADSRDFGVSKAVTQGLKTFLLKTFLLATFERHDDASVPVAADIENSYNRDRVQTEPTRTPPPAPTGTTVPGKLYVSDYKAITGETNGKTWTRYAIEFSDGRKTSTFDDGTGDLADHACKNSLAVVVTMTPSQRNPKYTDLVELALDGTDE